MEMKNYHCKIFHETNPFLTKQSLNNSFSDPSFVEKTSKVRDFFLPHDTPLKIETVLKHRKEILF